MLVTGSWYPNANHTEVGVNLLAQRRARFVGPGKPCTLLAVSLPALNKWFWKEAKRQTSEFRERLMGYAVAMTIEPDVTNQSREGLVTSGSMVITTKLIGPGLSGSIPSHSGNLVPYPRLSVHDMYWYLDTCVLVVKITFLFIS